MTDVTTLQTHLDQAKAARAKLANGERVTDVWRDGRRIRLASMTMPEMNNYIDRLEREIERATQTVAGQPRRRPIRFSY